MTRPRCGWTACLFCGDRFVRHPDVHIAIDGEELPALLAGVCVECLLRVRQLPTPWPVWVIVREARRLLAREA